MRGAVACLSALLCGCASFEATAQHYAELGQPVLAAEYAAGAIRARPNASERPPHVRQAFARAIDDLDARYARAVAETPRRALGLSVHMVDISVLARRLDTEPFAALVAKRLTRGLQSARSQAIAELDAAAGSEAAPREVLAAVRRAVALNPTNPRLNRRYQMLKRLLRRHMAVVADCAPKHQALCGHATAVLKSALTRVPRELWEVVPRSSELKDAELVVTLKGDGQRSGWQKLRRERVSKQIPKRNAMRDKVKQDGDVVHETVRATYTLLRATTEAELSGRVVLRDLRQNQTLMTQTIAEHISRSRHHIRWHGDVRAVRSHLNEYGTNQTLPPPARALMRKLSERWAKTFAQTVLERVQGGVPRAGPRHVTPSAHGAQLTRALPPIKPTSRPGVTHAGRAASP